MTNTTTTRKRTRTQAPGTEPGPDAAISDGWAGDEGRIDVSTVALRKAFTAVVPHADTKATNTWHYRVRLYADHTSLIVCATNGRSAGLAEVPLGPGDGPSAPFQFDLSPKQVKEILGGFEADEKDETDEQYAVTRIVVSHDKVILTDLSGLWPGKKYDLPRFPMAPWSSKASS